MWSEHPQYPDPLFSNVILLILHTIFSQKGRAMSSREISFIDNRISRVEGRQTNWTSSSARFSPVRVPLPNEILSYIFELGALSQEERGTSPWHYSFWRVYRFQLSVSHASRQFRNVAAGTPRLWTIIRPQGRLELQVDYIKMCLERSGSLPYTISLNYEDGSFDYPKNPTIDQIMTLVNSNIYRLERFFAQFDENPILDQIMDYFNKPAPLLTTLELSHTADPAHDDDIPTSDRHDLGSLLFDGQMPMLTTLLLNSVYPLRRPSYDLKNLTVLGLIYGTPLFEWLGPPQEFRTILENSPLLRKLILQGSMLAPLSLTEDDSPIKLEFLEYLEMAFLTPETAIDIVNSIAALNLKTLIFNDIRYSDNVIIFDAIVEPPLSFPNLTSLMLVDFETSEEALAKILHAYPNLESLGLYRGCEEESRWMHVLEGTTSTGGSRLCPSLKILRCVSVALEEIQDALERRKEANIPLPKLQLSDSLLELGDIPLNDSVALSWLQQNTQVDFLDLPFNYY